MMELDEAIKRAEEVANECTVYFQTSEEVFIRIPSECAEEHRQLSEWLKELKELRKKQRQPDGWVKCSDRLPTAEDGERVIVHLCFEKPTCEYVFVPWKTVKFEYQVGHIDAWFPIPTYKETE